MPILNPPPAVAAPFPAIPGSRALCPDHLSIVHDFSASAATHPMIDPSGFSGPCDSAIHVDHLRMTFDDEFDVLSLYDPRTKQGVWKTSLISGPQTGPYAWDSRTLRGNREQQIYVDPAFPGLNPAPLGLNPFSVRNGVVSIIATKTPEAVKGALWGFPYVSGMLMNQPNFAQRYGYFEIRARLPAGKGMWPAFWLLPADGSWPPELDVLEQLGGDDIYQTVHTAQDGAHEQSGFKVRLDGATGGFHTYGALWTPDRVVWFLDGRETATAPTPADMHKPMYILLNLAVGGDMPGNPDEHNTWPARFSIDYVRVYSLEPVGAQIAAPPPAAAKPARSDNNRHRGQG